MKLKPFTNYFEHTRKKSSSGEVLSQNQKQFLLDLDGGRRKQNGTPPPHIHKQTHIHPLQQSNFLTKDKDKEK